MKPIQFPQHHPCPSRNECDRSEFCTSGNLAYGDNPRVDLVNSYTPVHIASSGMLMCHPRAKPEQNLVWHDEYDKAYKDLVTISWSYCGIFRIIRYFKQIANHRSEDSFGLWRNYDVKNNFPYHLGTFKTVEIAKHIANEITRGQA